MSDPVQALKEAGKKAQAAADSAPKKRGRPKKVELAGQLEAMIASIGVVVTALEPSDPVCGTSILNGAESLAKNLETLAKQNPKIERALRAMLSTGAWSGVLLSAGTIALPILKHHGFIPGNIDIPSIEFDFPTVEYEPESPTPNGQVNGASSDIFTLE